MPRVALSMVLCHEDTKGLRLHVLDGRVEGCVIAGKVNVHRRQVRQVLKRKLDVSSGEVLITPVHLRVRLLHQHRPDLVQVPRVAVVHLARTVAGNRVIDVDVARQAHLVNLQREDALLRMLR